MANIGLVLMASGFSKRLGENKLLVKLNGKDVIDYTIDILPHIDILSSVVVTRYAEVVNKCKNSNLSYIFHQMPCVSDTIILGLKHLGKNYDGYMFMVADQPLKNPQSINNLISGFEQNPKGIYQLSFEEKRGNPVIFPATLYDELMLLKDEQSGSVVINKHLELLHTIDAKSPQELWDIDTSEDIEKLESFIKDYHIY